MSRLAGARGAAERALVNDHTDPGQPEAGGVAESETGVHDHKFTDKSRGAQAQQLFLKSTAASGASSQKIIYRLSAYSTSTPFSDVISDKSYTCNRQSRILIKRHRPQAAGTTFSLWTAARRPCPGPASAHRLTAPTASRSWRAAPASVVPSPR